MWNEIRKNFENLNINAIAINERLSRYIFFHDIDVDIRNKEMKKWKNVRIQNFLSTNQLSVIISKIVNDTKSNTRSWKQQTIDSSNYAFFESSKKMFSQIFNADWLLNSAKIFRDAKITIIMIFQINARSRQTEHVKTSKIRQNLC